MAEPSNMGVRADNQAPTVTQQHDSGNGVSVADGKAASASPSRRETLFADLITDRDRMVTDIPIQHGDSKHGKRRPDARPLLNLSNARAWLEIQARRPFIPISKKPLSAFEMRFLEKCSSYLTTFPKDSKGPMVSFFMAEVLDRKGRYTEVLSTLDPVIKGSPKHRFASYAAVMALDAALHLKRWDVMERWAQTLRKTRNFKIFSRRDLADLVVFALGHQMEESIDAGDMEALKTMMKRLSDDFSRHTLTASTLRRLAKKMELSGKTLGAVEMYEASLTHRSRENRSDDTFFILGVLYKKLSREAGQEAHVAKAAKSFEKASRRSEILTARVALYHAVLIRLVSGNFKKAIAGAQTYLNTFPKDRRSQFIAQALEKTCRSSEDRGAQPCLRMAMRIRAHLDQREQAIATAQHYLNRYPNDPSNEALKEQIKQWQSPSKVAQTAQKPAQTTYGAGGGGQNGLGRIMPGLGTGKSRSISSARYTTIGLEGSGQQAPRLSLCSKEHLRHVIEVAEGDIEGCFPKDWSTDTQGVGRVHLEWRITKEGQASELSVPVSTFPSGTLRDCLEKKAKDWRFLKPKEGACRVALPFVLGAP